MSPCISLRKPAFKVLILKNLLILSKSFCLDMVNELIRENWNQRDLYKDSFELAQKRFFSILELDAKHHQFP
ncbi:hypothetical protein M9Y10_009738 [Tritrichomonas musculus]|uniref:Uncharacterized protein n=1 Tax=Tritrichomonas musculus TaxID=1915356 RepID=A0ABR2IPC1_9EUKA